MLLHKLVQFIIGYVGFTVCHIFQRYLCLIEHAISIKIPFHTFLRVDGTLWIIIVGHIDFVVFCYRACECVCEDMLPLQLLG